MALLNTVDPEGLDEFSVVFTDRSLNHMSQTFQQVMRDISEMLKDVYKAEAVALRTGWPTRTAPSRAALSQQEIVINSHGFDLLLDLLSSVV